MWFTATALLYLRFGTYHDKTVQESTINLQCKFIKAYGSTYVLDYY